MKKYKIRDLQLCMLDMIKEIDKVCKKHNIEYYLAYGSCLGAVRHKGFIPWDDDLDIMLKYDQYQKFLKVCEEELDPKKYYVQTNEKEPNYYLSFAKIRNIKTTLIEENNKANDIIRSVYIDVFPLVGVPNSIVKRKLLEINRAFAISTNINVINNKFLRFVLEIIIKIFGAKKVLKYCTKQCVKYNCDDYDDIVSIFDGDGFILSLTDNKILGKPKYVEFEDTMLPIPSDYDQYLEHIYGDYMKIPNGDFIKEKMHTAHYINLNKPYLEYKNESTKNAIK